MTKQKRLDFSSISSQEDWDELMKIVLDALENEDKYIYEWELEEELDQ